MHPCFRPGWGPHMVPRNSTLIGFRHADSVAPFPASACIPRGRREHNCAQSEQRKHHDPPSPRTSPGVPLRPAIDRRTSPVCSPSPILPRRPAGHRTSTVGREDRERGARLVDDVLPRVPVRQWVLSFPYEIRYRLAYDGEWVSAVLAVFLRVVGRWYRRQAQALGK